MCALTQCSGVRPRIVGGVLCIWLWVDIVSISDHDPLFSYGAADGHASTVRQLRRKQRTLSKPPSSHWDVSFPVCFDVGVVRGGELQQSAEV